MQCSRRRLALVLLCLAVLLAGMIAPAGAGGRDVPNPKHGDGSGHPGTQSHPPAAGDDHSRNMRLAANEPRSSDVNQSDLAFQGRYAFAGNYNGFRVIDISAPGNPEVVADVWCPGPQNDISVWDDVIVLSVDTVMEADDEFAADECGAPEAEDRTIDDGWEGLRVFRLSEVLAAEADPDGFTRVQPVSTVYTDCGSHTHTGVPDGDRVLVYVSSYPLRSGPTCGPDNAEEFDYDPLHSQISIVEVPLGNPEDAAVLSTPEIDVPTWDLLEPLGFNPMQGCHDIQVDLQTMLAAAACASVGQIWDISDPASPDTLDPLWEVDEPEVELYHSALFSEDREVVVFGDESILVGDACGDGRDTGSGQLWFYDLETGGFLSSFQIPDHIDLYCSAHLFNNIPTNQGRVMAASWYNGGVRVIDYTDATEPTQVGHYRPAPTDDPVGAAPSGHWSAYWYNGLIYANDIDRGFDVLQFRGRERAGAGAHRVNQLNPQTQH